MKTLYIVRHAKSSWEFNIDDHQRPLNERGYKDSQKVGLHLASLGLPIESVWSSDANRAKTTATIMTTLMGIDDGLVKMEPKLYDFAGRSVIDAIKNCENGIDHLMVFGHNHAFTTIANQFGSQEMDNVPAAGVVAIQFDVDQWKDISKGNTLFTVVPKGLK